MPSLFVGQTPAISIAGGIVYLACGEVKWAMPVGAFSGLLAKGMREVEHFHRGVTAPCPIKAKRRKKKKPPKHH